MAEDRNSAGRDSPMIRLCLNCDTENPVDAVLCSECGMSVTRAPTGETAEKARRVPGVRDTVDQEQNWKRHLRWGLAVAGMVCWTMLVAGFGLLFAGVSYLSAGGVMGDPELAQWYHDVATTTLVGGFALALAPWVALLLQRWWTSRASEGPEDTKQDAG